MVAVGAQVASAAIKGCATGNGGYRGFGLESPVGTSVGDVDLVAGAAVLMGRVGIAGFKLAEVLASGNGCTEGSAGVTECTRLVSAFFNKGYALSVQGFLPGGFLAADEGCIVMALSTSQVCG